ncbi:hypothetical protein BO86DRAFT_354734 [Aspergillus japonicus CBS 114.51]|uniref:Nephrocystin 3-like N-terminal domain-containing protein n=1 Tax=Aspergillus japonicus CBS 114.51 TaxID=1448312 RepID=A0A8T8XC82_ASPJA|nr:hypothetical protein BO86DRAFT_354734 [Aspergillus japonicus CBS 114.51]RAH85853.1 hypothetical protein BO86DRAFT_354734 [Aspergillus japonicus CBS 114.51]
MLQKLRARFKSTKTNGHARKRRDDRPRLPPPSTNDDDRVATETDTRVSCPGKARPDESPRRNLWEVAGERLDGRHREALELESASSVTKATEGVITTTEQKYREYKAGGLKIRKRDGGEINVRDSAKNIILYALQAQELVKTLASFDPTGHVSSAWSIVSFGLTLLQNNFQRRDDIFEAAEYLARNLAYYAIVDSHYRERQVGSDRGLEDALVEVYMAILQYAAEVKEAEKESKATRFMRSITALIQQPLQDLKNTIESKAQAVQKWTRLTEDLDRRREAESMLDGIDEAVERLKNIQSHARSVQDLEILDWLSTASYSDSQNNAQHRRASNTGDWFLNLPEYKEWKATPGKICWLYGAVGCGKSVLCSTIIQNIADYCEPDSTRHFAYWYFQFSNDETQKVYNMIRSILRQFMPRTLPASVVKLWEEHRHRGSKPQQQKLAEILDVVLETSQGHFFLILDALDECPAKAGERGSLLRFLEGLWERHQAKLHIIATSRPEPDIRSRLKQYQCVNLETGLAEDVEAFVRAQVAHGRLCEWDESVKTRTLEKLLDIPERRRFRWADLQIKRLEESKTKAAFLRALDSIPVTLEDTYRDTLERLAPDDRNAARTILIWLCFSADPLDLKTVADVVSFRFPEDVVTTCTTSLVTLSISDNTVRLAHFSVKEFLVCNETECRWYQFSTLSGHDAIANQTIDSLLETTKPITKVSAMQQPLLLYAAKYWDRHLAELGDLHADSTGLQVKVDRLFTERDTYANWQRLKSAEWDYIWHYSFENLAPPLSCASKKGLKSTVQMLLAKGANPLESHPRLLGYDALYEAASRGHLDVLRLLICSMDEIPHQGPTRRLLQFIEATEADRDNLAAILDLLWNKGALHDRSRALRKVIDEKVAEYAASNWNGSSQVLIDLLLDRQEKWGVKITERVVEAALCDTCCGEGIVHSLLNRCDTVIQRTPRWMQKLISASSNDATMATLRKRVNDIILDEECVEGFATGRKDAMELLLHERGKEIQITQKVLITAARFARDPQTVSLLLNSREPGTDISKEVLLAAAGNTLSGNEIMNILLDKNDEGTVIDDEIIQIITGNESEGLEMIKTLLRRQQAGFVVTEQAFCNAAERHNREMLELLVHNISGSKLDLPITGRTLRCVAENYFHGKDLMVYLFDLQGHSLPVSEDTLVSIADVDSFTADYVLTFILERWSKTPVTDRLLEAACCLPNTIGLLLDRRSDRLPVERMVHKIAKDRKHDGRGLKVLLDRHLVEVNEWLVEMTAGNFYTLEVIRNRNPEFPVTSRIVVTAARNFDAMRIVLYRQKNQVVITEEVIKASLVGLHSDKVISLCLTRLGPKAVSFTEDALICAIQNNKIQALELLLEQRRHLNLSAVWEAIWQDPGIDPSFVAEAADALFQYAKFDVSDRMLERLPSECFDNFIRSCMQYRVPLPTTEAAFELIVERSDFNTVDIFLEDHPDFPITERHFEAAERNSRRYIDKDGLLLLLSTKSSLF